MTPIRVVCQNTVAYGLARATRKATIRHLGDASSKLHEARRVLELTVDYYEQFKVHGERLALEQISQARLREVLADSTRPARPTRAARGAAATREAIMGLFTLRPDGRQRARLEVVRRSTR